MTTIDGFKKFRTHDLASLAECLSPETHEGAGAAFLERVRDAVLNHVEEGLKETGEVLSEFIRWEREKIQDDVAEKAASQDTPTLWREFVELGGYREDLTDWGTLNDPTPTGYAKECLFSIAFRLTSALLTEIKEG
ncbi:hypothetical protein PV708_02555 [Streptomyces sp. ME02-6977A]|uniref:hypothetical protein n=1 Tax=Streptomyces sp. ME02-6977A TaxID=3028671 RepID=UPI0029B175B1|nr:hypothetical protein [Streptomyces sp. ME02-6977A]MDX3405127.1 hypothetical protein [Streptomyces sp. ME02-6977A]